ncbi:MAG: hypothetical protein ACM3X0_15255 [Bacteroidota bacterium]
MTIAACPMLYRISILMTEVCDADHGAAASEYAISLALIAAAVALAISQFDLTQVFPALVAKITSLVN